jgi:hypothetical protein
MRSIRDEHLARRNLLTIGQEAYAKDILPGGTQQIPADQNYLVRPFMSPHLYGSTFGHRTIFDTPTQPGEKPGKLALSEHRKPATFDDLYGNDIVQPTRLFKDHLHVNAGPLNIPKRTKEGGIQLIKWRMTAPASRFLQKEPEIKAVQTMDDGSRKQAEYDLKHLYLDLAKELRRPVAVTPPLGPPDTGGPQTPVAPPTAPASTVDRVVKILTTLSKIWGVLVAIFGAAQAVHAIYQQLQERRGPAHAAYEYLSGWLSSNEAEEQGGQEHGSRISEIRQQILSLFNQFRGDQQAQVQEPEGGYHPIAFPPGQGPGIIQPLPLETDVPINRPEQFGSYNGTLHGEPIRIPQGEEEEVFNALPIQDESKYGEDYGSLRNGDPGEDLSAQLASPDLHHVIPESSADANYTSPLHSGHTHTPVPSHSGGLPVDPFRAKARPDLIGFDDVKDSVLDPFPFNKLADQFSTPPFGRPGAAVKTISEHLTVRKAAELGTPPETIIHHPRGSFEYAPEGVKRRTAHEEYGDVRRRLSFAGVGRGRGRYPKKLASEKIRYNLHEMKRGRLRSYHDGLVRNRRQAIAIGISQARRMEKLNRARGRGYY